MTVGKVGTGLESLAISSAGAEEVYKEFIKALCLSLDPKAFLDKIREAQLPCFQFSVASLNCAL